jgi:REP element-mobilizing transposase RayT
MKTEKFQNKYRIPSARAVWHDYNGGDYFVTICTAGRECYFGEIRNGEMRLNVLGQKLDELIVEINIHNPYCVIPLHQIMPNHVHLIVCIDGSCRDAACHVSTGKPTETSEYTDAACHVSTVGNNEIISDAACHVSTGKPTETSEYTDAACHVSTGKPTETSEYTDAACHVSTVGNNEKMRDISQECGLLSTAIGGLKSALTKFANANSIAFKWQTRFHDRIIRDQDEMNRIATYIEQNPIMWMTDKFYVD